MHTLHSPVFPLLSLKRDSWQTGPGTSSGREEKQVAKAQQRYGDPPLPSSISVSVTPHGTPDIAGEHKHKDSARSLFVIDASGCYGKNLTQPADGFVLLVGDPVGGRP